MPLWCCKRGQCCQCGDRGTKRGWKEAGLRSPALGAAPRDSIFPGPPLSGPPLKLPLAPLPRGSAWGDNMLGSMQLGGARQEGRTRGGGVRLLIGQSMFNDPIIYDIATTD